MKFLRLITILLFFVAGHTSVATAQGTFSIALRKQLAQGIEQNEKRQYLEAYRTLAAANDSLEASMRNASKNIVDLSEVEFERFYWPIKKSLAEVAYMLGMHKEMDAIIHSLYDAISLTTGNQQSLHKAELFKIQSGRHFLLGNYTQTEEALQQALALAPPSEPHFKASLHSELAQLYYAQGRYNQALAQLDSISPSTYEIASQKALCRARIGSFEPALKEIDSVLRQTKKSTDKRAYAETLRKKGKILILSCQFDSQSSSHPATLQAAKDCYEKYLKLSKEYLNQHFIHLSESEREQYWMAERPFLTDCYQLENTAPQLLYDLTLYSKALLLQIGRRSAAQSSASLSLTWRDVQRRLPDTAAAVEFVVYEKKGEDHLGALVLTKRTPPRFVYIAPINEINQKYNLRPVDETYSDTTLPTLIWNPPLLDAIGNSRTIYFAPDGPLHQLAIEYLLPEKLHSAHLYRLTSTRLLATASVVRGRWSIDSVLLVGGIDYRQATGSSSHPDSVWNDPLAYTLLSSSALSIPPLPHSLAEVDSIAALRHNLSDRRLVADSASEYELRSLMGSYRIFLISTHGWFAAATSSTSDLNPPTTDLQLSHSCLFVAGAERNLQNPSFPPGCLDGVISARELAGMDLHNVELAILSACSSGLGEVTPDGVFGLQRGLKTAGVSALIVSLWEVDDLATSLLLKYLFANLQKGIPLHQAFENARKVLKETSLPGRRRAARGRSVSFDRPYFYDAFILIDGISG